MSAFLYLTLATCNANSCTCCDCSAGECCRDWERYNHYMASTACYAFQLDNHLLGFGTSNDHDPRCFDCPTQEDVNHLGGIAVCGLALSSAIIVPIACASSTIAGIIALLSEIAACCAAECLINCVPISYKKTHSYPENGVSCCGKVICSCTSDDDPSVNQRDNRETNSWCFDFFRLKNTSEQTALLQDVSFMPKGTIQRAG